MIAMGLVHVVCRWVLVDADLGVVVDHPRVDADFRVASDCRGSGARSLRMNAC